MKHNEYFINLYRGEFNLSGLQVLQLYRFPLRKLASYVVAECSLPTNLLNALQELLIDHEVNNLQFNLEICHIQNKEKVPLVTCNLLLVHMDVDATLIDKPETNSVRMYFVPWHVYEMQQNSKLFTIYENMSALDAIKDILNKMKSEYNLKAVKLFTKDASNFVYEQILARADNDLVLPVRIADMYKPAHTQPIYFVDFFHYEEFTPKPSVFFFTLFSRDLFPTKNVLTTSLSLTSRRLKSVPLHEFLKGNHYVDLLRDKPKITVKTPDMIFQQPNKQEAKNNQELVIHTPDSKIDALKRFDQTKELVLKKLHSFSWWEIRNYDFEMLTLCQRINIDIADPDSFNQLIVGLKNVFRRAAQTADPEKIPYNHDYYILTCDYVSDS